MKRLFFLFATCIPLFAFAQSPSSSKGIKWITGLSFKELKEKAKNENKYLFLDVYATWCIPCKGMDEYIYPTDSVGSFFNDKFISAKVQMDKTASDDKLVKSWYEDAKAISKAYHIEALPTYLFFNPKGNLVHKDIGSKKVREFIDLGRYALTPGLQYNDTYFEDLYKRRVDSATKGILPRQRLLQLLFTAKKYKDTTNIERITKNYLDYISSLPAKELYGSKFLFSSWISLAPKINSPLFLFVCQDRKQANQLSAYSDFAERVIDNSVMQEIILPFLNQQNTFGPTKTISEPNWESLNQRMKNSLDPITSERNMYNAKIMWRSKNPTTVDSGEQLRFEKFEKFPPTFLRKNRLAMADVNEFAWTNFEISNNKEIIEKSIFWCKKAIDVKGKSIYFEDFLLRDTYAQLLYKRLKLFGKGSSLDDILNIEKEAIKYAKKFAEKNDDPQGKAMAISQISGFQNAIVRMQKGENTGWIVGK